MEGFSVGAVIVGAFVGDFVDVVGDDDGAAESPLAVGAFEGE